MTADSRVLYVLIVLLLIASLALFYMVVLRHRLRHRASLDDLYQRLISVLRDFPENAETLDSDLQSVIRGLEQSQFRQPVEELRQMLSSGLAQVQDIEAAVQDTEERAQRWRFEHDRLYVMNQILDNSLSTIKHETMYFPSRIKQLADDMLQSGFDAETNHNLLDLVTYYRYIYMLLYEQALGQTDQAPLRMQPIAIDDLFGYVSTNHVSFEPTTAVVLGEEKLLRLFLDQLIAVVPQTCQLSAEGKDGMVYVNCDVHGQSLASDQISNLFTPQTERLEYLVMRQIVREHDAACGHPGLRLACENTGQGYRISFSLLQSRNNEPSK